MRAIADFTTDFPDDQEDDGEVVTVYGGRGVAEHVAAALRRLGYDVTAPAQVPPYGWRFDAWSGRGRVMLQVSDLGEEIVLGTYERTPFLTRLFNRRASVHADLLTRLHAELTRDGRFHNIRWWDRYDGNGTSANEPVSH
jgi:hypothetical protein